MFDDYASFSLASIQLLLNMHFAVYQITYA